MFTPVNLSRASDQVVRQIIELIESGKLKPGDQLPGERDLTQQLSISRSAIREAIRLLEAQGLLDVRAGLGTFVSKNTGIAGLPVRWSLWLAEHQGQVLALLQVRSVLEPLAAGLAAKNATAAEIDAIREAIDQIDRSIAEGAIGAAVDGDIKFHHLVSQCSGNSFLIELNRGINEQLIETRYAYYSLPDERAISNRYHHRILDAIRARDSALATEVMRQHIEIALQNTQTLINQVSSNRAAQT